MWSRELFTCDKGMGIFQSQKVGLHVPSPVLEKDMPSPSPCKESFLKVKTKTELIKQLAALHV